MRIRKGQIIVSASLVVVFGILIAIQFFHFRGIKDSLERLVNQKTKGQYKLDLGETKYDFIRLDFTLKNAHIYRIDTLNEKRIYTVELPYVRINLGSLESYFSFGQINVKEFEVTEPTILLKKGETGGPKILLSSELSRLLDIINEVLLSFNIHSFKIKKGAFDVTSDDQNIRVNLIDFLAQEWNVRKQTKERQIEIKIGAQEIVLGDHKILFNEIEYNYMDRQLTVSDFSYHHRDPLTDADIVAKGKTFIVYHVDWQELSSSDRYRLKRIELINTDIRGSFPLPSGKKKDNDFFKMLYNSIGDFLVDSLIVREANVHLSYKQKKDSTSVSFKNANFSVTDFHLLDSKEFFEVNEVRFNLNKTELIIGAGYVLKFDSLFFNRYLHNRLRVANLELSKYNQRKPFLTTRYAEVSAFNPFDFMMNKRIEAESVELDRVSLTISPELFQMKNDTYHNDMQIDIRKTRLSHANIYYSDKERNITVDDLSVAFNHIQIGKTRHPTFTFDQFKLNAIVYHDHSGNDANIKSILLSERRFSAASVEARQKNGISLIMDKLAIDFDKLDHKLTEHFTLVHAEKMQVRGTMKKSARTSFPNLSIDKIVVDTAMAYISVNKSSVKLQGFNFSTDSLALHDDFSSWNEMQTELKDLVFENDEWIVHAKNSMLSTQFGSRLNDLHILKKDSSVDLQASSLLTSPFHNEDMLTSAKLIQVIFDVKQQTADVNATVDSIFVDQISVDKKPSARHVSVFHPVLDVHVENNKSKSKKLNLVLPEHVKEVSIHNANVTLTGKSDPMYVYNADIVWNDESQNVSFDSLTMKTKQDAVHVSKLNFTKYESQFGSISITPLQSFEEYSSAGFERDRLTFKFNSIKAKGYLLDSLLYGNTLDIQELSIGGFQIDAFRDKRMPDAPAKEKELFSLMLRKINKPLNLPFIHFDEGMVTIKQISDKTRETGLVTFNNISGDLKNISTLALTNNKPQLTAKAQVYNRGVIQVNYEIETNEKFKLNVIAEDIDLTLFNQIVQPLQSVRFKSGNVKRLTIDAEATDSLAIGNANITYSDAKIEILDVDRTNLRNEIVSVIANEVIKNKRKNYGAPFTQEREKAKSEFAYWVKIVLKGASTASRHGKKQK